MPARAPTAGTRTAWPGISDIRHDLCLALALWNGNDPILKERMFGLTGPQGNHGEDVKEYWWYLEGAAQPRAAALALPLPAGRLPLRAARPPRPRPERSRARAARHGRVRRGPLLVGRRHVREGFADRGADADRAREPRAGRGDDRRAADAVVPQHLVVGRRGEASEARRRRLGGRRRGPRARRLPARGGPRPRRRAARGALLRERDERAAGLRVGRDDAVPEGRDQRPRRLGRRHRQPGRRRHEGGVPLPRDRGPRRHGRASPAPPSAGEEAEGRRQADLGGRRLRQGR